jgi:cob(I)alamin adenosyltransferase
VLDSALSIRQPHSPAHGRSTTARGAAVFFGAFLMVYLSRIYTKSGDQGDTGLGDGSRVPKDHPRVAAYGSVDELNAVLGLLVSQHPQAAEVDLLRTIQNDLFDVGADLCLPRADGEAAGAHLRVRAEQTERLEQAIDRLNANLTPLTSFILPGGQGPAAWCHLARTVCRRVEREVVTLARGEPVNTQAIVYLNRLSDLLFVLARVYNNNGRDDILWRPGQTQTNP